ALQSDQQPDRQRHRQTAKQVVLIHAVHHRGVPSTPIDRSRPGLNPAANVSQSPAAVLGLGRKIHVPRKGPLIRLEMLPVIEAERFSLVSKAISGPGSLDLQLVPQLARFRSRFAMEKACTLCAKTRPGYSIALT